jgi:hypothetical protein
VFFRLRELVAGDLVETMAADGAERRFAVSESWLFEPANAPLDRIFGPTPRAVVTLITCGGAFLPSQRDYTHRIVVRAALI